MHTIKTLLSLGSLGLFFGCSPKETEPPIDFTASDEILIRKSQNVVDALKEGLSKELGAALQSGGVPAAIEVCQTMATPITEGVTAPRTDIGISRTALRTRNPDNAPDAESRAILEAWEKEVAVSGQTPKPVVSRSDRALTVHFPIRLQANCLACHGDPKSFQPEITAALQKLYPDDAAIGFSEGDLRGAFRVEFRR
jgi:hypothetical protein